MCVFLVRSAPKCDISDSSWGQWSVAALPMPIFGRASAERELRKPFEGPKWAFVCRLWQEKYPNVVFTQVDCVSSPEEKERVLLQRAQLWSTATLTHTHTQPLENCRETQVSWIFIISQQEKWPVCFGIIKAKSVHQLFWVILALLGRLADWHLLIWIFLAVENHKKWGILTEGKVLCMKYCMHMLKLMSSDVLHFSRWEEPSWMQHCICEYGQKFSFCAPERSLYMLRNLSSCLCVKPDTGNPLKWNVA